MNMDLFVLDGQYRRIELVDQYESLIWTERFNAFGEFDLVVHSTNENRNLLKEGTWLSIEESHRTMVIETREDKTSADGEAQLILKGRSLEAFLDDRIIIYKLLGAYQPKWVHTGLPAAVARQITEQILVDGDVATNDILTMLVMGSPPGLFPPDTITEPSESVPFEFEPQSLYAGLKNQIYDVYDLGFRIVRVPDQPYLYFDVYAGSDRTSSQDDFPVVLFSPDLDNLQNTTEFTSIASYKNVALVRSKDGLFHKFVWDPDEAIPAGLNRKTLFVQADEIETTDEPTAETQMELRGLAELAKHRKFEAFDGEINQNTGYIYGTDYHLGDLVEMRNVGGATNKMRVTEQIFISDAEGIKSYPTLAISLFVQPGTWLAWDYNQVWLDLEPNPMTWADQP